MKIERSISLLQALVCLLGMGGCVLSPISHTNVTEGKLQEQWGQYQDEKTKEQQTLQEEITKTKNEGSAAIDKVNAGMFAQLVTAMNDPQNSGTAVTILTSIVVAIGGGLHLNNLRLNRKIAHPEVPFSATGTTTAKTVQIQSASGGKPQTSGMTQSTPLTRGDQSLQGATAATVDA